MVKTIIADDHPTVLKGLVLMVSSSEKYKVIGTANNGQELLELINKSEAELIIMDYKMPLLNGVDVLLILNERYKAKFVFVTSHLDEWFVARAKELGAVGVISKEVDEDLLLSMLDKIMNGEKIFPSEAEIYEKLYAPLKHKYKLTERETNTIKDLNKGLEVNEIAKKNNVSPDTVKSHKKNAFEKLGIKKATMLAQLFNRI
jgi:DNA-binding NarL/FixJ family response regulator